MKESFDLAMGSIRGRDHERAGRNNQDSCFWTASKDVLVAVVCDGCGSGAHSEVGAKIGAPLVANSLARHLRTTEPEDLDWEVIRLELLEQIQGLAALFGGNPYNSTSDYLLFTIVGVALTRQRCSIFSLGDGVALINDRLLLDGRSPDNRPPYLAYGLVDKSLDQDQGQGLAPHSRSSFRVDGTFPTEELVSIVIGTDGVQDLLDVSNRLIPGKKKTVGPLGELLQQDKTFENPDWVRRRLTLIGRDSVRRNRATGRIERQSGLLPDDTTLILIRRKCIRDPVEIRGEG